MRPVFIDTEFTDLPWTPNSELLWVGLADEAGASFSAVNSAALGSSAMSEFVREHVVTKIDVDELRLDAEKLSLAVREFCAGVDEFWAWCPTVADLATTFDLGERSSTSWAMYWDWDLQLLKRLVSPWPSDWPIVLNDLNAACSAQAVILPPNDLAHHPRHDALWNRKVFGMFSE